jgi:hypothetical protein
MSYTTPVPFTRRSSFYFRDSLSGLDSDVSIDSTCTLSEALKYAAQADKNWVLDTRYKIDYTFTSRVPNLSTDAVTLFTVRKPFWDTTSSPVTTNARDVHSRHGGLYYIGDTLKAKLQSGEPLLLSETGFSDVDATTRRYPYPIRILSAVNYERTDNALSLKTLIESEFKGNADVKVFMTDLSIYDTHKKVVQSLKTEQSVLFIDSDFCPNTNFPQSLPEVFITEEKYVHLWYVQSVCNANVYGNGGPKLINKSAFDTPITPLDMTTSIGDGLSIHDTCVGTHAYNWSAESAWRTGFREGYKLRRITLDERVPINEVEIARHRLIEWVEPTLNKHTEYFNLTRVGAQLGAIGAETSVESVYINDYNWLHRMFLKQGKI